MFQKTFFTIALVFFAGIFPTAIFAAPVRVDPTEIESSVSARAYVVIDRTTGTVLTLKQENLVWPIASLTKLMTADLVLQNQVSPKKLQPILKEDDVGGAKLYIKHGDKFSVDDLFYAMLSGTANNAANALARTCTPTREDFVKQMNARAKILGLNHTTYADPSGMELANTSTVMDVAKLANIIFIHPQIQRYTTTPNRNIRVANTGAMKKITSTNWMLFKPAYDDVWVTGGKTGYLEESGWNLAVTLRPSARETKKELLIVLFGADSRAHSFEVAKELSDWAWNVYEWK